MAKRFFFVSAGILCLALAYQLGASNATAQAPGNPVVAVCAMGIDGSHQVALTANGDQYSHGGIGGSAAWVYQGNIFGQPVQASPETWGGVKDRYRK